MPYIDVWVDPEDVIADAKDELLVEEIKRRALPAICSSVIDADTLREWSRRIEQGDSANVSRELFLAAFQCDEPVKIDTRRPHPFLRWAA